MYYIHAGAWLLERCLSPSSHTSAGILFKQGPTLTQVGHLHVVENDLDSQILKY